MSTSLACGRLPREGVEGSSDTDQKRVKRLLKNRESAQASRERKKAYVETLEKHIQCADAVVSEFQNQMSHIYREILHVHQSLVNAQSGPLPCGFDAFVRPHLDDGSLTLLCNLLCGASDTSMAIPLTRHLLCTPSALAQIEPVPLSTLRPGATPTGVPAPSAEPTAVLVLPAHPRRNQRAPSPGTHIVMPATAVFCLGVCVLPSPPAASSSVLPRDPHGLTSTAATAPPAGVSGVIAFTFLLSHNSEDPAWEGWDSSAPPILHAWAASGGCLRRVVRECAQHIRSDKSRSEAKLAASVTLNVTATQGRTRDVGCGRGAPTLSRGRGSLAAGARYGGEERRMAESTGSDSEADAVLQVSANTDGGVRGRAVSPASVASTRLSPIPAALLLRGGVLPQQLSALGMHSTIAQRLVGAAAMALPRGAVLLMDAPVNCTPL